MKEKHLCRFNRNQVKNKELKKKIKNSWKNKRNQNIYFER